MLATMLADLGQPARADPWLSSHHVSQVWGASGPAAGGTAPVPAASGGLRGAEELAAPRAAIVDLFTFLIPILKRVGKAVKDLTATELASLLSAVEADIEACLQHFPNLQHVVLVADGVESLDKLEGRSGAGRLREEHKGMLDAWKRFEALREEALGVRIGTALDASAAEAAAAAQQAAWQGLSKEEQAALDELEEQRRAAFLSMLPLLRAIELELVVSRRPSELGVTWILREPVPLCSMEQATRLANLEVMPLPPFDDLPPATKAERQRQQQALQLVADPSCKAQAELWSEAGAQQRLVQRLRYEAERQQLAAGILGSTTSDRKGQGHTRNSDLTVSRRSFLGRALEPLTLRGQHLLVVRYPQLDTIYKVRPRVRDKGITVLDGLGALQVQGGDPCTLRFMRSEGGLLLVELLSAEESQEAAARGHGVASHAAMRRGAAADAAATGARSGLVCLPLHSSDEAAKAAAADFVEGLHQAVWQGQEAAASYQPDDTFLSGVQLGEQVQLGSSTYSDVLDQLRSQLVAQGEQRPLMTPREVYQGLKDKLSEFGVKLLIGRQHTFSPYSGVSWQSSVNSWSVTAGLGLPLARLQQRDAAEAVVQQRGRWAAPQYLLDEARDMPSAAAAAALTPAMVPAAAAAAAMARCCQGQHSRRHAPCSRASRALGGPSHTARQWMPCSAAARTLRLQHWRNASSTGWAAG
ncbi:hypothetical protein ABPG75_006034 [Micractinium tetrahymenae]